MKYGNKKATWGDIVFDSKRERDRWCELVLLENAGKIHSLQRQVPFLLIPAQPPERKCTYIADFVYTTKDGVQVVEDAKGFKTPEYIIKRKLMLQVHGVRIREV